MDKAGENLKLLYEQGNYAEVLKQGAALINAEGVNQFDVNLLIAKALLMTLDSPTQKNQVNMFHTALGHACNNATSIEDVVQAEQEIFQTLDATKLKIVKSKLRALEANPSFVQWKSYYPMFPEFISMRILVYPLTRKSPIVSKMSEEAGLEEKEFIKQHFIDYTETVTDEDINALEYSTELTIFRNIKEDLAKNKYCSADYAINYTSDALERLMALHLLASSVTQDAKKLSQNIYCERQKKQAEIDLLLLDAAIIINGTPFSLLQSEEERHKIAEGLRKLHSQIQATDPSYNPPLIVVAPKKPKAKSGCYVATAIYGSYDCPQVWTLRRYRDEILSKTWYGRAFIHTYYAISPTLVKWFGNAKWFKSIWEPKLNKMVEKLNQSGVKDTPYSDRNW